LQAEMGEVTLFFFLKKKAPKPTHQQIGKKKNPTLKKLHGSFRGDIGDFS